METNSSMFWIGSCILNFVFVDYLVVAVTGSFQKKEWIRTFFKISFTLFLTYLFDFWHHKLPQTFLLLVPQKKPYFVDYPKNLEDSMWSSLEQYLFQCLTSLVHCLLIMDPLLAAKKLVLYEVPFIKINFLIYWGQ